MLQPPSTTDASAYGRPIDPIAPLRAALSGHYDIEREIGQGAFATVYLARDLKHERKVAIKVLNADPNSETGELRFIREIRLLARLQHPNILPLHDSGHVESLLYYVMPFVSGETLRARIDRERQLSTDAACSLARDIADALAYAHGQGIIHRDIKPENILLSAGHPILADFGIARAIDLAGVRQLTRTGMGSPGTPAYMSPEQLLGEGEIDARSDIYSLGCVLYEMLCGKPPFTGKDGFVKRFTEPPPQIAKARPGVGDSIQTALSKALARNASDRYSSAADFALAVCPPGRSSPENRAVNPDGLRSGLPSGQGGKDVVATTHWDSTKKTASIVSDTSIWRGVKASARGLVSGTRFGVKRTTVLGAAAVVVLASAALALRYDRSNSVFAATASLDSSKVAIFPFAAETGEGRVIAARVADGLYDAIGSDWDGLRLVEATKVEEALHARGDPETQSEAISLAKRLGAGKLVWGQVITGPRVRAALYDVATGSQEKEIAVETSPAGAGDFGRMATDLLKVADLPVAAHGGDGGTRSFPAWRSYGRGHVALANWDLPGAESAFKAATQADPAYAAAQLWLAEIRALRSYNPIDAWHEQLVRALSVPNGLHARDSVLAKALNSMGEGAYDKACDAYRSLTAADSRDYIAWYSLGLCTIGDNVVVPDIRRPGTLHFRSSFLDAGKAFDKATQLEPRLFAILPFDTLVRVAPIEAAQLRVGVTSEKPRRIFLAYPSLAADTLAYTPFPLTDVQSGGLLTTPRTAGLAARRNRAFLLRVVLRWIGEFPQSPDAYEALSILQEASGELGVDRGGVPSALSAVQKAEQLSRDDETRALRVLREIRLRLKSSEFEKARGLADSLLASRPTPGAQSPDLSGLAALTGRLSLTQRLLPPTSVLSGSVDRSATPSDAAMGAATDLFVRAALGSCNEDMERIAGRVDSLVEIYVAQSQQESVRGALTEQAWSMAVPCRPTFALRVKSPVDRLLRMQQAFARGQLSIVRAQFDTLAKLRENDRPGDVSPDVTYQEAWLLAAMGDTAGAVRKLDLSLGALPTMRNTLLDYVPQAAGLVRAMILRANLAQATNDTIAARRWAAAVATLWSRADSPLQPTVRRMRSIMDGHITSADSSKLSRR
ncbi:MAG: protein kinase domain-containing protein [Gemmatimonadaceae bacterium]